MYENVDDDFDRDQRNSYEYEQEGDVNYQRSVDEIENVEDQRNGYELPTKCIRNRER